MSGLCGGSGGIPSPLGTPRTVDRTSDANGAAASETVAKPEDVGVRRVALKQIAVFEPIVVRPRSTDVVSQVDGSTVGDHPGCRCPHGEAEMDRPFDPVHVFHSGGIAG